MKLHSGCFIVLLHLVFDDFLHDTIDLRSAIAARVARGRPGFPVAHDQLVYPAVVDLYAVVPE